MSDRLNTISRLRSDLNERLAYIRAKLAILVPSQIKALRLKSNMPRQSDLAREADLHQSRISMFETPGAANMTIETLSRLAATFKTGLIIKFVPFSEMLEWENEFSQDSFDVTRIDRDTDFLDGNSRATVRRRRRTRPIGQIAHPANRLFVTDTRTVQMGLFSSTDTSGCAVLLKTDGYTENGPELEALNALLIGGMPDGRQEYNPVPNTAAAIQERAVA